LHTRDVTNLISDKTLNPLAFEKKLSHRTADFLGIENIIFSN
jgi:hypothetical protein